MIDSGNVDGKWSGKKMEGDDDLKTVECLRGRLLAERVTSRVAKEDADQMRNKLTELENRLRVEIKSRNRAENRLKLLLEKLESLNISHLSENSEQSSLLEKIDVSSVSSTASSRTKEPEDKEPKSQITNPAKCDIEEYLQKRNCPIASQDLEDNASQTPSSNQSHCSPIEESLSSTDKVNSEEPSVLELSRNRNDPKTDDHSFSTLRSSVKKEDVGNNDQAQDDCVDNSLALVPIDLPKESQPTEPPIINASVKDVLDALRHAREKLQCSMERRHMIKVGSK